MELPKNITQIGEADRTCKVYVEDYVVSYMKQLCRQTERKGLAIALYGKYTKEQSLSYFFIYGACRILSINKEVRHLSQAQNQEVERLRQHYFPEYVFLGYHIFDGEMVEGMHIQEQDTCRYIKGYACFYEKNDSMLAYMVDNNPQDHEPEEFGQEKYDRARARQEERRSQYGQKKAQPANMAPQSDKPEKCPEKKVPDAAQAASLKMMRMSAVAVFAVLGLIGVAAITREGEEGTVGERAMQLWAQFTDAQPESGSAAQEGGAQEATAEVYNSGTLMAENSLADAILQENQEAAAVAGQAVAGQPQQDEENGAQPSQEGGDGQNIGETGPGQAQNNGQEAGQGQESEQPQEGGQGQEVLESGQESQSPESLNPDTQPTESQPDTKPQEIPTQGPSIADIEAQQQSQQQSQPVSYVIQPGDTLIGISTRQYGNDSYVQAICELNGISNPDNIQIDQKILLP